MKRKLLSVRGTFVAVMLAVILLPAAPARAVSSYDDVVQQGEFKAVNPAYGEVDLSTTFWQMVEAAPHPTINGISRDCTEYLPNLNEITPGVTGGWLYVQVDRGVTLYSSQSYNNTPFTFQTNSSGKYPNLNYNYQVRLGGSVSFKYVRLSYLFNNSDNPATIYDERLNIVCGTTGFPTLASKYVPYSTGPTWTAKPILSTIPVTYPSGYEGITISDTWSPPTPTYVAMGDSFSSGEGNPPFEGASDANGCHRSSAAYPRLLQSELGEANFVACSGATTDDVINGKNGEPSQLDALSTDTEVVTITVGGNNIQFKEYATACISSTCDDSSSVYTTSWAILTDGGREDYLPSKLEELFGQISNHLTTENVDAEVWIVGYPYAVTGLSFLGDSVIEPRCSYLTLGEAMAAETLVDKLNEVIGDTVSDYKYSEDLRFNFVNPNNTPALFEGHELCTDDPYINGIDSAAPPNGSDSYVFHPNGDGHAVYADTIAAAIVLAG